MTVHIIIGSKARQAGIMMGLHGFTVIRVSDKYHVAADLLGTTAEEIWNCHHTLFQDTDITQHPLIVDANMRPSGDNVVIYDCLNSSMLRVLKTYFTCRVIGVGTIPWGEAMCNAVVPNVARLRELVGQQNGSRIVFVARMLSPNNPDEMVKELLPRANVTFRLETLQEFYDKAQKET